MRLCQAFYRFFATNFTSIIQDQECSKILIYHNVQKYLKSYVLVWKCQNFAIKLGVMGIISVKLPWQNMYYQF